MVGLDLTHQALATPDVLSTIKSLNTPLSRTVVDLLTYFRATYRKKFGFPDPPVHDPCAVAHVIQPGLLRCQDAFVAIEVHGTWTTGMTVTDFDGTLEHHLGRILRA